MNLRACLNPKVLTALAAVAVGVALFAPRLTAALPIIVLACPLSMLAMGWAMRRHHTSADSDPADPVDELAPSGDQLAASPEARA